MVLQRVCRWLLDTRILRAAAAAASAAAAAGVCGAAAAAASNSCVEKFSFRGDPATTTSDGSSGHVQCGEGTGGANGGVSGVGEECTHEDAQRDASSDAEVEDLHAKLAAVRAKSDALKQEMHHEEDLFKDLSESKAACSDGEMRRDALAQHIHNESAFTKDIHTEARSDRESEREQEESTRARAETERKREEREQGRERERNAAGVEGGAMNHGASPHMPIQPRHVHGTVAGGVEGHWRGRRRNDQSKVTVTCVCVFMS